MNDKAFLIRFYATMFVASLLATLAGSVLGVAVFELIKDRNVDEADWFPNLVQGGVALLIGAGFAYGAYAFTARKLAKRLLAERYETKLYVRMLLAPVINAVLSVAFFYIPGFAGFPYVHPYFLFPGAVGPIILTGAIVLPLRSVRTKLVIVASCFGVVVALGAIEQAQSDRQYDHEQTEAFARWDGPLMLTNGDSATLAGPEWLPASVAAPYSNDSWERIELSNHRMGADGYGQYLSVSLHNTPIGEICPNSAVCEDVGDSKYGTVYQLNNSNTSFAVSVPKGHLEITDSTSEVDPIALVNALDMVDADTFVEVTSKIQDVE